MAAEPGDALAPIVVEVTVPCTPGRAFDYFTRDIGRWWPLATHSLGRADAVGVRFEPFDGGGLIESLRDGREHRWGQVTRWNPGVAVAFTWHLERDPASAQWVDVRFTADATGTRVTLTHGGWEHRADGAAARANYAAGWKILLGERYGAYCAG